MRRATRLLAAPYAVPVLAAASLLLPGILARGLARGPLHRLAFAAALAVLLVPVALRAGAVRRHLRAHVGARRLLLCALAALVTWALLSRNLDAWFGLVDDYEIVEWTGSDGRLGLGEALERIATHPEVGDVGSGFPRYRPSYYTLRLFEAWAFGAEPAAWYAWRMGLFLLLAVTTASLLLAWLGPLGAGPGLLLLLGVPGWYDVWTRLGPAEQYGTCGLALLAWGAVRVVVRARRGDGRRASGPWAAIVVGFLVSAGAKENFLFTLPVVWGLFGWLLVRRRVDAVAAVCTALVSAVGIALAVLVLRRVGQSQQDIYHQGVGAAETLALVPAALGSLAGRASWAVAWLALGTSCAWHAWLRRRPLGTGRRHALARSARRLALAVAGLVIVYVGQYVFYRGALAANEVGSRYDLPALLVPPLIVLLATAFAWRSTRIAAGRGPLLGGIHAGLTVALALLAAGDGLNYVRSCSGANAHRTRAFHEALDRVAGRLRAEASRPVVFVAHDVWDFEPAFSAVRFLRWREVTSTIHLELAPDFRFDPDVPIERALAEWMERIVAGGDGALGFRARGDVAPAARPFGIGFRGPAPADAEDVGPLW